MTGLPVTIIQANLHWENKEANLRMFEEKIRSASRPGSLVVLPEMFSTGFSMNPAELAEKMDGSTLQWMKRIATELGLILTGSLIIEENRDGERLFFNRLIWMLPNGQQGFYDKRHLFAFAGEHRHYARGNKRLIASVNGWRICLLVCYDLRFPVWSRQQIMSESQDPPIPEYDVLIYVANWPERRSHAWKTLLTARAIENQCYVIGVNRVGHDGNGIYHSGDSIILNPMGETLYTCAHQEDVHTQMLEQGELQATRSKFPFLVDRDDFSILT